MRVVTAVLPAVSIVLLLLAAVLPWGLPAECGHVLPLLPFVGMHYWLLRQPQRVPEWLAFACGFTLDVLTHGPLGFWSLLYLIGYAFALLQQSWGGETAFGRAFQCLQALMVVGAAEWGLASVYSWVLADWWPLAVAIGWAALSYPVIAMLLRPLDFSQPRRANSRLIRGA
jgi:rod shape-determining protein MreD